MLYDVVVMLCCFIVSVPTSAIVMAQIEFEPAFLNSVFFLGLIVSITSLLSILVLK